MWINLQRIQIIFCGQNRNDQSQSLSGQNQKNGKNRAQTHRCVHLMTGRALQKNAGNHRDYLNSCGYTNYKSGYNYPTCMYGKQ
jgi:hypothetical protein